MEKEGASKEISNKSIIIIIIAFVFSSLIVFFILNTNKNEIEARRKLVKKNHSTQFFQMDEKTKHLHDIIISLEKEVANNPQEIENIKRLADAYFDIGSFKKALHYYKMVVGLSPKETNVLIDAGVSYFNLGNKDSAIFYIKRALAVDPLHKQGLYNLGIIYYNIGMEQESLKMWKKVIKYHEGSVEAVNAHKFIEQLSK